MATRRNGRQGAIKWIVRNKAIRTQRDLVTELRREGFSCTQATVSRDIADMGLRKLPEGIFENLNPLNIALALLVIALGVMLYGFIAGLCGAMVSKMEELQESVSLLTITNIVGSYLALAAALVMQSSITTPLFYIAVLVPISSPFLLPGVVLIGVGSWEIKILSLVILMVMDVLILFTSARVYEALLLYNGNKIKFKDLKKFLKEARGGKTA